MGVILFLRRWNFIKPLLVKRLESTSELGSYAYSYIANSKGILDAIYLGHVVPFRAAIGREIRA